MKHGFLITKWKMGTRKRTENRNRLGNFKYLLISEEQINLKYYASFLYLYGEGIYNFSFVQCAVKLYP